MVTIRLSRGGAKKRPFYHIVVADVRAKRDGRYIERIGFFNPIAVGGEQRLRLDRARADHWLERGAQPTDRVRQLIKQAKRDASTAPPVPEQAPAPQAASEPPANPAPEQATPTDTPADESGDKAAE